MLRSSEMLVKFVSQQVWHTGMYNVSGRLRAVYALDSCGGYFLPCNVNHQAPNEAPTCFVDEIDVTQRAGGGPVSWEERYLGPTDTDVRSQSILRRPNPDAPLSDPLFIFFLFVALVPSHTFPPFQTTT
jgi:hypothetical protein